ncbi:hypothetical protein BC628DRAFT_331274 [Trametes gibbosa]|nr:hypothetical protein BC628DRAFT_331274 [Trametes gibbosa]
MSADGLPDLDSTIGVELIGCGMSLALYGITTGQVVAYIRRYGQPPVSPCIYLVAVLWTIDTLHMILVAHTMATYLVLLHGNATIFVKPPWTIGAITIISEINGLLVRLGYAYRIWRLSGKKWLVPFVIVVLSILVPVFSLAFTVHEVRLKSWSQTQDLRWTLYSGFSCQIVTDSLIAAAMFVVLRRFRTGLRRLDLVIRTIMMYIVNTGVLTILGSALCIIFFIVKRTTSIYTGIYFTLSKLCTCSFLGVLNAEQLLLRRASGGAQHPGPTVPVLSTTMRLEPSALAWEEEHVNERDITSL